MVTQEEIAKKLGLDVSTVNKILNAKPGSKFKKSTIDRVIRLAQDLGYNLSRLKKTEHHRNRNRCLVSIPADLQFSHGNKLVAEAWGIIHDLSLEGLGIAWIETENGHIPDRHFSLRIRAKKGLLRHVELRARVVRMFYNEGALSIGARFLQLSPKARKRLTEVLSS